MSMRLVNTTQLDSDLTSIANAIREKTGGTSSIAFPAGFISEIEGIRGGFEDDIIQRTISGVYENSTATLIGQGMFSANSEITSVSFAACSNISNYAFYKCTDLTTAYFPSCQRVGSYAFSSCYKLVNIYFPMCSLIDNYAFAYCSSLTTASFPACTSLSADAFQSCSALTTAYFPSCSNVYGYAFANCPSLVEVSLPVVRQISACAFSRTGLLFISLPSIAYIYSSAFYSCFTLSTVIIGSPEQSGGGIMISAFAHCYKLKSFYLLQQISLSASGAFYSTPIAGYLSSTGGVYGSIFVPSSLYDTYISMNNWSYFSSRFVSLTDAQISNVLASGTHL